MAQSNGLGGAIVDINYRDLANSSGNVHAWNYNSFDSNNNPISGHIVAASDHALWPGGVSKLFSSPRAFQVLITPHCKCWLRTTQVFMGRLSEWEPHSDDVRQHRSHHQLPAGCGSESDRLPSHNKDIHQYGEQPKRPIHDGSARRAAGRGASVQKLPNGHWLIANSYSGTRLNLGNTALGTLPFSGEVFEYNPSVPNTTSTSTTISPIVWSSPSLVYTDPGPGVNTTTWLNWPSNLYQTGIFCTNRVP